MISKYKDWRKKLKIWQTLTELKSKKEGPVVLMILQDKAKEAVLELRVDKISGANGVNVITDRLDKTFLKDQVKTTYLAYEKFEKFKRPETLNITSYIVEFGETLLQNQSP